MTSERATGQERTAQGDASGAAAEDASSGSVGQAASVTYDLQGYERLLKGLLTANYEFVGFDGEIGHREVALRHDVDLSVERAAAMAEVEAALGVQSTYFFLVTTPVYDLLEPETREHLRTIVDHGHDVGLHFDPHYYWDEEPEEGELTARVVADRNLLERVADVETSAVSVHVPPEWALSTDFEGFDNTYRPAYFDEVAYRSDSNQKWHSTHPFADGAPDALQLLVHPGLWQPEEEAMADILEDRRADAVGRVDEYLSLLGE